MDNDSDILHDLRELTELMKVMESRELLLLNREGQRTIIPLLEAAVDRLSRLEDALKRYGSHDEQCARYRYRFMIQFPKTEPTCLCGFGAVLAASSKEPPENTQFDSDTTSSI